MNADNKIYLNNLNILKQNQPELAEKVESCEVFGGFEVIHSKNGLPVLKEGNVSFHSIYDPVKDGERFVDVNLKNNDCDDESKILYFGIGFGYHIKPVFKKNILPAIFEPRIEIIKIAMENVDLTEIFTQTRIITELNELINNDKKFILWPHHPSVKNNIEIYESLKKIIENDVFTSNDRLALKDKLNITVVTPIYGGSLPVAKYCARALEELGHKVDLWDASIFAAPFEKLLNLNVDEANKKILYDLFQHLISEMIVASCAAEKPDLLIALAQAPLSIKALERLKQANILTAFWFVEDYKHMEYWKSYAPFYDFYFTIQKGEFFDELKNLGVKNYYYLPMAADPEIHCVLDISDNEKDEFGSKLSFMGAGYYNRQKIFSRIKNNDFKIWGNSWDPDSSIWKKVQRDGQRVTTEETVKIFNSSAINLNLHSYAYDDAINTAGDFVNPRTFEIASCGAFQLVDKRSNLKDHFVQGEEMISFDTEDELNRLIDFYINKPEERKRIHDNARKRVLKDHTYLLRMKEMLCFIKERKPECFIDNTCSKFRVKDKNEFIRNFPEVEPVLNKTVNENRDLNIDSIADVVRSRQSDLKYHEALFLLMDEFKNLFVERSA